MFKRLKNKLPQKIRLWTIHEAFQKDQKTDLKFILKKKFIDNLP